MRVILLSILLTALSCGHESQKNNRPDPTFDLNQATPLSSIKNVESVGFSYAIDRGRQPFATHSVLIENKEDVDLIVETLKVQGGMKNTFTSLVPYGRVIFILKNGKTIESFFVKPNQLEAHRWGQVAISQSFYELACEYASKAEGRRIDVLKLNK